jgi:carbamoyl-phosphate synthase large subunit
VRGLLNVQFALSGDVLYVLEANPRASRTVPFVSKATAVPLAKAAARIALGASIAQLRREGLLPAAGDGGTLPAGAPVAVKEAVLPWSRFRTVEGVGIDVLLGPEMRSTGEVMGIDTTFGAAFAKSQAAAGGALPTKGRAFVSVTDRDKPAVVFAVRALVNLGFEILATEGTAAALRRAGVAAAVVGRPGEAGPTVLGLLGTGEIDLVVNTTHGRVGAAGGFAVRAAAVAHGVPFLTTIQALSAAVAGIETLLRDRTGVCSLQEHSRRLLAAGQT